MSTQSSVRINGALAEVDFPRFDLESYRLFLRCKGLPESQVSYDWQTDTYRVTTPARFAPLLDASLAPVRPEPLPLAGHLFDYQRWIVRQALAAKRQAVWADTGLGKGPMLLEWCRQVLHLTQARVLILEPLSVIPQLCREAARFYGAGLPIQRLSTREDLTAWCASPGSALGICNYEKLIEDVLPEFRHLGGLAADESSLLKTGGGVIKWNLIKSARGIEYKSSWTATPAPNDTMEYASQASFLEKLRSEGEVLWTFFQRDKTGEWRVKPHARDAFYRFMASWSVYLRDPAHFGFADILSTLPAPEMHEYRLPLSAVQQELMYGLVKLKGGLFSDDRLGIQERSKLSQLAKGFLYDAKHGTARIESAKPAFVADLVRQDTAAGHQVLVWTVFDEESALLSEQLAGDTFPFGILSGAQTEAQRADLLERFRAGDLRCLISKPQLLGYGLNLQFVRSMVFSGFDDSFERMYQAIRRAYRFGQTETVRVHVPYIPELEGMIFSNVKAKEARFLADVEQMEAAYRHALAGLLVLEGAA